MSGFRIWNKHSGSGFQQLPEQVWIYIEHYDSPPTLPIGLMIERYKRFFNSKYLQHRSSDFEIIEIQRILLTMTFDVA